MAEPLDPSYLNRACPPGSLRYFSLLYAPAAKRDFLAALYVVDAEIQESARSVSHDVAHTRMQWWREEIKQLANGRPRHPATRVLAEWRDLPGLELASLHEALMAADMDLACLTYADARELTAYCRRSAGVLVDIAARWLSAPAIPSPATRDSAQHLGIAIRQTEIIRDLRQDVHDGRLYLPLDELEQAGVGVEALRMASHSNDVKALLEKSAARVSGDLTQAIAWLSSGAHPELRPLTVLAALHARLLQRIVRSKYDIATQRVELKPFERVWTAWRAARSAG